MTSNKDMPAMPLSGDAYQDFAGYDGTRKTSYNPECQGLTKLEVFMKDAPAMPVWFETKFISDTDLNGGCDYSMPCGDSFSISLEGAEAAFMAWPMHYAKALLSQLEDKDDE